MTKAKQETRGARNHNPLNIRIGNSWLGEAVRPDESDFEVFVADKYGLRAGFIILRRYIRRYHKNTIRKIVTTWAPTCENPTDMYINYVSHASGIDPDKEVTFEDEKSMVAIVKAMAYYESRVKFNDAEILAAYKIA